MKKILPWGLFFLFVLLLLVEAKDNTQRTLQPENRVEIAHKEVFGKLEYGKVIFEHQKHIDALKGKSCEVCHMRDSFGDYNFTFPKGINRKNSEALKDAYHRECLRCHLELASEKKKTGPTVLMCRECHRREYEKINITYPKFEFDFFLHDKHVKKQNNDCSLCHHTYDPEEKDKTLALFYEEGTEQSCYYCHDFTKKRGPHLSKIVKVAKEKNLNLETSFHKLCINCHLRKLEKGEQAGPTVCTKCHTGKYRSLAELKDVPRPDRYQPKMVFMKVEDAKMKGVPMDHLFHEKNSKSCRVCHHESLEKCSNCHTIKGSSEANFKTLHTAYHSLSSQGSCKGCHLVIVQESQCMGCHYFIKKSDVSERGKGATCERCHSDKKELEKVKPFSVSEPQIEKIKKEIRIDKLSEEFEPAKMPHFKILARLTEISNRSHLATYFHKDISTLCKGCHHKSKEEAEARKYEPPLCSSCHGVSFDLENPKKLRLQSAYHGMCIKCHENMKLEKPKKCTDCHEEKKVRVKKLTERSNATN